MNCKAYQAIGAALSQNPFAQQVPCHRVVRSNGEVGGFMGSKTKEQSKKIKMLVAEGVEIQGDKVVNFTKVLHKFD